MQYQKTVTLPSGEACLLRHPTGADAADILGHLIKTSAETTHMARYADEITMTEAEERDYLTRLEADPKAMMISAVVDGLLVANAGFSPVAPYQKCRHRAAFGISVQKAYWGRGIGAAVLSAILEAAKAAGYEQLELDVVSTNERAIALYEKLGFQRYGILENAFLKRDGSYDALVLMCCRL